MNDLNIYEEALALYATGYITYGIPVGADYADGSITYGSPVGKDYASGTITYNTPVGADYATFYIDVVDWTALAGKTVTVDGTALVEGVDWTAGTDNNTTGTSLAAAIDGLAGWGAVGPGHVVATAATRGTASNGLAITTDAIAGLDINGAGVAGSVSAGGVTGDRVAVDGSFNTCVVGTPGANEFATIADLTSLIDALGTVSATDDGSTVTVVAASRGAAGNALTIALDGANAGDMAISGATLAGGTDGDIITVAGQSFTCVVGATGANEFAAIADLTSLVDALANISATDDGSTVTIVADARGTAGNAITLALGGSNAGTMAISGATLAGGVDGDTVEVDGNTFTCVIGTAGGGEFSSIVELEALVEAVAAINSTQDGTTVTINADATGTAGNAITLALGVSNAGTMAISGATLTGGAASLESDVLQIDSKAEAVQIFGKVANLTSGATVTITPYVSPNNIDWRTLPAIIIDANESGSWQRTDIDTFLKFTIAISGATTPSADVTIQAQPSEASTEIDHDFYDSDAAEASAVVKVGAGKFYSIAGKIVEAAGADDYYVFAYDAAAVPSDGALDTSLRLMLPIHIDHAGTADTLFSFSFNGRKFENGLVVFISTTDDLTKTLAGTVAKFTTEVE